MEFLPFVEFLGPSFGESKRILKGKVEYLRARIYDIESIEKRGKKRKRDEGLCVWVDEGCKLLKVAENLLTQVEDCGSAVMRVKKKRAVNELVHKLALHEKEGASRVQSFNDGQGLHCGDHIPVKKLVGRAPDLVELEHLLRDPKVGRVAILGRHGIGKSFLMKHLHNTVLKWVERFDYIFWVTTHGQFSIKHMQDALAAVLKCDLAGEDDLNARAQRLSNALASLGSFVLFLDGIPESDLSLDQIGIPVPSEGSRCKVVLTTSSAVGCRILDGFRTVELGCLPDKQAFDFFVEEAKIDMATLTLPDSIPRLLVRKCCGVPRMIVDLASRMCGIDDPHEWRNALSEFGNLR